MSEARSHSPCSLTSLCGHPEHLPPRALWHLDIAAQHHAAWQGSRYTGFEAVRCLRKEDLSLAIRQRGKKMK